MPIRPGSLFIAQEQRNKIIIKLYGFCAWLAGWLAGSPSIDLRPVYCALLPLDTHSLAR